MNKKEFSMGALGKKDKFVSMDDKIDEYTVELSEIHSDISRFAIKNADRELDLAISLLAQTMTVLGQRSRARKEKGTFGQEN